MKRGSNRLVASNWSCIGVVDLRVEDYLINEGKNFEFLEHLPALTRQKGHVNHHHLRLFRNLHIGTTARHYIQTEKKARYQYDWLSSKHSLTCIDTAFRLGKKMTFPDWLEQDPSELGPLRNG